MTSLPFPFAARWGRTASSRNGEAGAIPLMLMAKPRHRGHRGPENAKRYFKPSPESVAEVTGLPVPGGARRRAAVRAVDGRGTSYASGAPREAGPFMVALGRLFRIIGFVHENGFWHDGP